MPIKFTKDHFKWTNGRGHTQRPILYSQKKNNYGLGKKEHSSDQWWEKAFDNQLKNLDVSNSSGGDVTLKQNMPISTAIGVQKMEKYYICFVRGGILQGEVEKKAAEVVGEEKISTASEVVRMRVRRGEKGEEDEKGASKKRTAKKGKGKKEERRERKKLKRLVEKELELLKGDH